MRLHHRCALALALNLATVGLAVPGAQARPPAAMVVIHPWIAAPPGGAPTAAGYLTLRNGAKAGDVFLGGRTAAAQRLELHSMVTTGGVMRMRPAQAGAPIGPGQTLSLAPGDGYHLMLVHPTHPLKPGERVAVTLAFARAGPVKTIFVVEAPGGGGTMP